MPSGWHVSYSPENGDVGRTAQRFPLACAASHMYLSQGR